MYGTLVLFDEPGKLDEGERVYLGDVKAKDEAWLRDTLFKNLEIIPIDDVDSTCAPLVPLSALNFALMRADRCRILQRAWAVNDCRMQALEEPAGAPGGRCPNA